MTNKRKSNEGEETVAKRAKLNEVPTESTNEEKNKEPVKESTEGNEGEETVAKNAKLDEVPTESTNEETIREPVKESTESNEGEEKEAKKAQLDEVPTEVSNETGVDKSQEQTEENKTHNFKICSWNVAGLKAWVKKDGLKYIKEEDADIVCLQETKCLEKDLPGEVLKLGNGAKILGRQEKGYHMYWYSAEKKGYSGVALWSKTKPIKVKKGMGIKEHDNEGRLITAEYEKFFVVTSYVPNSGNKLIRLEYRRTWNAALKDYLGKLKSRKPVVFCGDLNVAYTEIDLANPKTNKRNAGFTVEERDDFTELLNEGYVDSFRKLQPKVTGAYTFWTYMANARSKNLGWRLDYFVISNEYEEKIVNSEIRSKVMGSDHCPIVLTLNV